MPSVAAPALEELVGPDGPGSPGDFAGLLQAITIAVQAIALQVNKGALGGSLGAAGTLNVQGEAQARLDVLSNEIMIAETQWGGYLAGMVSEELATFYPVPTRFRRGQYLLVFDPLDGSSNIDANIPTGTIFSILRTPNPGAEPALADFLQPGTEQVCAGFALYGPATMLILTTGSGVDGYTLDRELGTFILTHPQIRIPEHTSEFAINTSNERFWEPPVRRYVAECLVGRAGPRERDFNMRWVASLVAETFRILTRGGVFLYPADSKDARSAGRLRLLYECSPISFIVEQAGGSASTGRGRVLDVQPGALHQRIPFIFGSSAEVDRIERYHREDLSGSAEDFSLFNNRSLFRV
ncbi:class 1 fructose-bisphosphatase [Sporichthya sp.]|uniref:class 1 fructose-bisphosphatase n=1 Tax=Sporichthya sp. TaxID=65475 RepID=UPI0018320A62|nr:class 1 fructose-bisphosphatase [Sporichthya sp.]MBA3741727.1 class 1 fructose-bisphosphatase [Sporichthya sp.]